MRVSVLVIFVCFVAACAMQTDISGNTVDGGASFPLRGNNDSVEFSLTEDVFRVERAPVTFFLIMSLFIPLFYI